MQEEAKETDAKAREEYAQVEEVEEDEEAKETLEVDEEEPTV